MSSLASHGDDDETDACTRCGNLRRKKPDIIPGYDPPQLTHLFEAVRE